MEGINVGGAALLFFLAGVVMKIVGLIKERIPGSLMLKPLFLEYGIPLISISLGMAFAFGIEPLKAFTMIGIPGVSWWLDKLVAGLIMGLGGSVIFDFMDTKNRDLY